MTDNIFPVPQHVRDVAKRTLSQHGFSKEDVDRGDHDRSLIVQEMARLDRDSYARGRAEGLEEAAKVADSWCKADYGEDYNILADSVAREIRSRIAILKLADTQEAG